MKPSDEILGTHRLLSGRVGVPPSGTMGAVWEAIKFHWGSAFSARETAGVIGS
jgi:hypothetical protein